MSWAYWIDRNTGDFHTECADCGIASTEIPDWRAHFAAHDYERALGFVRQWRSPNPAIRLTVQGTDRVLWHA